MERMYWKGFAEVIGISAIIGSLIFVGLQMRQDQDIAIAQIWAMSDQSAAELSGLLAENRDLWVKGMKGEELSEVDQAAFRSVAWAVFRRHGNIANRVQRLSYGGTPELRARQFAYELYQSPGLRHVYEEFRIRAEMRDSAFGYESESGFNSDVQKFLAELDRFSPPVPDQLYVPL